MRWKKILDWASWTLLGVGGFNWLLVAFGFNLIAAITGSWTWLANTVYVLTGLSAIVQVVLRIQKGMR